MEGITRLTQGYRSSKKTDDSSGSEENNGIDISTHSNASAQSIVSFLSITGGGDYLLDDLDSATSQASQEESEDILARSSDSSLSSSQSGDSIVESGESDPDDDDDDDDSSEEEVEEEPSEGNTSSPTKTPGRGLLRMASSDSLFGGVCKFFTRDHKWKKKSVGEESSKKEIPASRTRRGGKRGGEPEAGSSSPTKGRGVARTSTSDSLVGASRTSEPQRGVPPRTSTSDSLTGVHHANVHTNPLHAARTRRGGKRNKGEHEVEFSENASNDAETREPTRGVIRTSTTDSLGGVDPKKHNNPLHTVKTRRGGRKTNATHEETSETADDSAHSSGSRGEPTSRGVMRTSTSDSLGGVSQKKSSTVHAGRTRRGGKRNQGDASEPSEGVDGSDSLDTSLNKEPSRGVMRTSTSDSLTGVDTKKHTNALHAAKTRRGGRRNGGDDSEHVEDSADASAHSSNSANAEPSRGVMRTSTSDSLTGVDTKRAAFPRQTSKTRRGGRRNRTNEEGGDGSEGLDTSEYVADTSENTTTESDMPTTIHAASKTRRGGRRNATKEESAEVENVPRTSTVDSLLGTFGLERKRGVQRTSTTDSLTGFDSKKTRPVRGGTDATTTSDESTKGKESQEKHQRSKTTVDKVLGAFGLQRGVARTSTSDSLTGVDTKKIRNKEVHASRTRRGGRRNRGGGEEDESERSWNPEGESPQGKVVRTNTNDSWAQRLMKRPLPRTLTSDSLQDADPNRHNNTPMGTKTRRGSRRPSNAEMKEFDLCDENDSEGDNDDEGPEEDDDGPMELTAFPAVEVHIIDPEENVGC